MTSIYFYGICAILPSYILLRCIYNVVFHPLARYPGPIFWSATRLGYVRSTWQGRLHTDVQKIHEKYGDVVRIAPDEVSFAQPDAWNDIYSTRGGKIPFPKTRVWHETQPSRPASMLNLIDHTEHTRVRRILEPGFSARAVEQQESLLQHYVSKFIKKLGDQVEKDPAKFLRIEVVEWVRLVVFDVIGELSFGESFQCLENSGYHVWMDIIFKNFNAMTLVCTLRYYPGLFRLSQSLIPPALQKEADEHWRMTRDKVDRRLADKEQLTDSSPQMRADLMALLTGDHSTLGQRKGAAQPNLSLDELYANTSLLVVAGSETVVTTLSGALNRLTNRPECLKQATQEVRAKFKDDKEITLRALRNLPYLNAVIKEVFRMCNPTPMGLPRITPPGGGIVCGHALPAKTYVSTHPLAISFSPRRFHEPYVFHPERWLSSSAADETSPFYDDQRDCINVFGVGPQSCLGKELAWAEVRLVLCRMLWGFDIAKAETEAGKLQWESQRAFAVVEKSPFEVVLHRRQD